MPAPAPEVATDEVLAHFVAVLLRFGQPSAAQGASVEQMAKLDAAWRAAAPSGMHIGQALAQCTVAMHEHERRSGPPRQTTNPPGFVTPAARVWPA